MFVRLHGDYLDKRRVSFALREDCRLLVESWIARSRTSAPNPLGRRTRSAHIFTGTRDSVVTPFATISRKLWQRRAFPCVSGNSVLFRKRSWSVFPSWTSRVRDKPTSTDLAFRFSSGNREGSQRSFPRSNRGSIEAIGTYTAATHPYWVLLGIGLPACLYSFFNWSM